MHVERYGHGGGPVLLLHGFGTCSFLWRNVAPIIAVANRTAFALDLFGYGESDRPFDSDYSIAAQAEYVDRAMTALRLSKATIVGVDLGGAIAMRLAATRPERVERMVLVNPMAFDDVPDDGIKSLQRNTARFAFRISRGVLGAAPLLRELLEKSVADPAHMPDRLVARYLAPYVGKDGVNHLLTLARSVDEGDIAELELRELDQPTLIVWGDQDAYIGSRMAEQVGDAIGGSRVVHLSSAGRLVPEDAPETLANLILEFVGAVQAARY